VRRALTVIAVIGWIAGAVSSGVLDAAGPARPARPSAASLDISQSRSLIDQYCVTCHNTRLKTAGLVLENADLTAIAEHNDVWEKVVRKLRTGAMPPAGARRPDAASYDGLAASLEAALDRAAAAHPNPGRPGPHRMNRAEYANAIRDLLALDLGDVASLLPPDDSSFGFDNIADVLGFSSVLLERYVGAAERLSALAVGDTEIAPGSDTFILRQDYSQDQHVEGQPLGTIGGTVVRYTFPLDAEYDLRASLVRTNVDQTRGLEYPHDVEFTIDGERVSIIRLGGDAAGDTSTDNAATLGLSKSDQYDSQLNVRVPVTAGPHVVGVAFVLKGLVQNTRRLQPYRSSLDSFDATGLPHIRTLSVTGPFNTRGTGDTPSRRRIFVCRPTTPASESACARRIISTLARRAYRQPASAADMNRLMEFYKAGRREGSFDTGIQRALYRILASPKFVVRVESDPPGVPAGTAFRIGDYDLASRLSFFLWSSIPDDQLLERAARGRLHDRAVLAQQVRRMLADPRSSSLVSNFAGQWLQLRNLKNAIPDNDLFPEFDDNLRQSFARETELLFESIMREDRSVLDLLTADYTFVNERLAKHYQIPFIYGSQFRRVPVSDEARKGILGHGSILTITSNPNRTSPVVRGKWVLSTLLGAPPPAPPANVPPLKENSERIKPLTMREAMEEHRQSAVCASCHKTMDPLGFALENFDAVGVWRNTEAGGPIDASGVFIDGSRLGGVVSLRQAILDRPHVFVGTMAEKLLTYALGRGLGLDDMPAVRQIVRESAQDNYRFASLITAIVTSTPFKMRLTTGKDEASPSLRTAAR
jgi:mono/diheme cytochrome c family protein